jgi:hypothetical protein
MIRSELGVDHFAQEMRLEGLLLEVLVLLLHVFNRVHVNQTREGEDQVKQITEKHYYQHALQSDRDSAGLTTSFTVRLSK